MKDSRVRSMTTAALMTAVLCILCPVSVPIGPVPVSLSVFVIFIALYVLGWKMGTAAVALYILMGAVGLPVFSGFTGGIQKLLGPTGGYIAGYIPMALLAGIVIEKCRADVKKCWICVLAMELSVWVLYLMGTAWLAHAAGMTFRAALGAGVLPFIAVDLAKIIAAALVGPVLFRILKKAGQ